MNRSLINSLGLLHSAMSKCTAAIYSAEMALQGDYGFAPPVHEYVLTRTVKKNQDSLRTVFVHFRVLCTSCTVQHAIYGHS